MSEPTYPGHGAEWDMAKIHKLLSREDWEEDDDSPDQESRRVYLGTIFGLTPSGKFYAPFACGNVMGCPSCHGRGVVDCFKRRVVKKRAAKQARSTPKIHGGKRANVTVFVHRERRNMRHAQRLRIYMNYASATRACTACGGLGSREAHLDEVWSDYSESLFESNGLSLECRDGDYFAVEYRAKEDE